MVKIDIVVLNYNTRDLLAKLLPLVIERTNLPNVQVVVADNASQDGSVEFLRGQFPDLEIIELKTNLGYAGGYNAALANRNADYFILLNSDAEPEVNWLNPFIDLIETQPNLGAAQPKLLDYYQRDKFEYAGAAGGFIDKYGYPFCKGRIFGNVEKDKQQYDADSKIFWATGACFLIKREAWEKAEGLDARFFAHMEEIDLCWSLQLMVYEIYTCPKSIVYHMGGGTLSNLSPRKTFLNFRNNLLMLHKNLHPSERNRVILMRKFLDGLAACFFILQGKISHIPQVWKAHRAFAKLQPEVTPTPNPKLRADLEGLVMKGLVWNYFVKGKKTFKQFKP